MGAVQSELDIVTEIAREAGEVVLSYFGSDRLAARAKGERDVVTAADFASERLLQRRLSEAFPGDGVVAEEGTRITSPGGRRWLVDPLDGTVNYAHGIPIWCVSLALFEDDVPVLGVIRDPLRDETFYAARGAGVWCNGAPLACGQIADAASSIVHVTIDFNEKSLLVGLEDIQRLAPRVLRTRNIGSVALALAYVAASRMDAVIHRFANAWDYGAGVLLVQEAGGVVSDMHGAPYTARTYALIGAATSSLHGELLGLVGDEPQPA